MRNMKPERYQARIDNPREKKPGPVDMTGFQIEFRWNPDPDTGLGGYMMWARDFDDLTRQYNERMAVEKNGLKETNTIVPGDNNGN